MSDRPPRVLRENADFTYTYSVSRPEQLPTSEDETPATLTSNAIHARDVHGLERMQCPACHGSGSDCKMCLDARVIAVWGRNPYRCSTDCPLTWLPTPERFKDDDRP